MVIFRTLFICILVSPLAAAIDWTDDIELVKDMVVVDKEYIPLLLSVRDGDARYADDGMAGLNESWKSFDAKWNDTVSEEWRNGFARVSKILVEYSELVAEPRNLADAYSGLNEIRHILGSLRAKEGIDYFVDFGTLAEVALDTVVEIVNRDSEKPLTGTELDAIEKGLRIVQERWNVVAKSRFDKIVYRIDIYYMGDIGSTRSDGIVLIEEALRESRKWSRAELSEKLKSIEYTVRHFLEILGSTPGN